MLIGKARFQFAEKMQPIIDAIYLNIYPNIKTINRFAKGDDVSILDSEFGIDVKLSLNDGMVINGQEKSLSYDYREKRSVTVEYYNDPIQRIQGDWFKLACQFYFVGYTTEDMKGFNPWVLLDWMQVVLETQRGNIHWASHNPIRGSSAKANFRYTSMDSIPPNCIIACQL